MQIEQILNKVFKPGSPASESGDSIILSKNGSTSKQEKLTGSTSELERESLTPACPDCAGMGFLRANVSPGHPAFGKPIRCPNPAHLKDRARRLAGLSGLSQADMGLRLEQIKATPENKETLRAAWKMAREPKGFFYIWGGPGNAKSDILIGIVNEVNRANLGPAKFLKLSQLINHMREASAERDYRQKQLSGGTSPDSWQNMGYIDLFSRLLEIPVLAIDELDKARLTDFALEFQFDFLDERWRQAVHEKTATIFASQSPPGELPDPVRSRIEDGRFIVIHNTAGDARPDMEWTK